MGTKVVAVASGEIVSVQDSSTVTGPHVRNLFHWNGLALRTDTGLVVEYVHILAGSARVAPGDRVEPGQVLCLSGAAGFCPAPHLHIQASECVAGDGTGDGTGDGKAQPSVPIAFRAGDGSVISPRAGLWYGPEMLEAGARDSADFAYFKAANNTVD